MRVLSSPGTSPGLTRPSYLVVGGVVLFAVIAIVIMSMSSESAQPYQLDAGTVCINPDIEFDGSRWVTEDLLPEEYRSQRIIPGEIMAGEDSITFRADVGFTLRYKRQAGFGEMPCVLG